jgi:hypothetical protein
LDILDAAFKLVALAQQLLGVLRMVPKRLVTDQGRQLVVTTVCFIPVKDASSAVQSTA